MPETVVPVKLGLTLGPFDGAFKPTTEEALWGKRGRWDYRPGTRCTQFCSEIGHAGSPPSAYAAREACHSTKLPCSICSEWPASYVGTRLP